MRTVLILAIFALSIPIVITQVCSADHENRAQDHVEDLVHQIKVHRAMEVAIWALPAVTLYNLEKNIQQDLKGEKGDVVYFNGNINSQHGILTVDGALPLILSPQSVVNHSVVLEIPSSNDTFHVMGMVVDSWQRPIVEMGVKGVDEGKGGNFYFFAQEESSEVLEEGFKYRPKTKNIYISIQLVPLRPVSSQEVENFIKTIKINKTVSGTEKTNEDVRWINASDRELSSLPEYDIAFFEDINAIVQRSREQSLNKIVMDYLVSLGIEKEKEFKPSETDKQALLEGLERAFYFMQHHFETPGLALKSYWQNSHWMVSSIEDHSPDLSMENEHRILVTRRGGLFFWNLFYSPRLREKAFHLVALRDQSGNLFNGNETYQFRIPADTPAGSFWTVNAYSAKTKGFIKGTKSARLSSLQKKNMKVNEDGSVDIFFSPISPRGHGDNWIQTRDDFFIVFRLYNPEDKLFHKTWKLSNVEKI